MIPLKEIMKATQLKQQRVLDKETALDFSKELRQEGFTVQSKEVGSDKVKLVWF